MNNRSNIDWNFHINFSPMYAAFVWMILFSVAVCLSPKAQAEEIEEVVVVGQQSTTIKADPLKGNSFIRALLPGHTWTAGGYGAFQGYNERGAQNVHTAVYKNGIPANLPGSAWYDFGNELATGQEVKIITGANSVVYGSGSIAGTILIKDNIEQGVTAIVGSQDHKMVSVAPAKWFQYTAMEINQDSVRNDNTERDWYTNRNAKLNFDVQDFTITMDYTDYSYDYDNCYDSSFNQSNDCEQDGEKYNIAINNEYFTIGRTHDKADYYTGEWMSYANESSTDYLRVGDQLNLSNKLQVGYGVDASHEKYQSLNNEEHSRDNYGAYLNINADFAMKYNFGFRVGNEDQNALRFGLESGPFFLNVGNSYRRPTLYELHGDGWVDANPDLLPEEGVGYEIGFGVLSLFRYEFEEAIEYVPGFNTEVVVTPATYDEDGNLLTEAVTENVWTNATYDNTGAYDTQGIRYSQWFGNFMLTLKYTDTEQARVPKYVGVVKWNQSFGSHEFDITYRGNFERIPGPYDGDELENLENLSFRYIRTFAKGIFF